MAGIRIFTPPQASMANTTDQNLVAARGTDGSRPLLGSNYVGAIGLEGATPLVQNDLSFQNSLPPSDHSATALPGGRVVSAPRAFEPPPRTEFQVVCFERNGGGTAFEVILLPGFVEQIHPLGNQFYIPTIGGTSLNANPRPVLTLAGISSHNYVHYETDNHGAIKAMSSGALVEVISSASVQTTTPFVPPNEDGTGTDGDYYIEVFETVPHPFNSAVPLFIPRLLGNIIHEGGYVANQNLGTGENAYIGHDVASDNHQWRTHKGQETEIPSPTTGEVQREVFVTVETEGNLLRYTGAVNVPAPGTPFPGGGSGSLVIQDPDGATVRTLITWANGLITTNGQVVLASQSFTTCQGDLDALKTTL